MTTDSRVDQVKTCVDCNMEFTITAGEAQFFEGKGMHLPKRCKPCREHKRKFGSRERDLRGSR